MKDDGDRMKRAMSLADKCWAKAMAISPEFVESYLQFSEELLVQRPLVMGDEFREYCRRKGLRRPSGLHHNVWVSGPRALQQMGWITQAGKVEPAQKHNHMPTVTLWRSMIYGQHASVPEAAYQPSLFERMK